MPRAIDHLVIAARDLPEQAALFRRLGFQVGACNRHPWGTENHIVQFDGAFLELIGLGDEFAAPHPSEAVYPFAGFLARYLGRREGLAMMAMRSADAEADRRGFETAGIGGLARFDFARKGRRPDGREVEVAFSLAFAASPALPETGFFVCQQHFSENFWSRAAQVHPNGARGISGLAFAAEQPDAAAEFLAKFVGTRAESDSASGFRLVADGARVEVAPRDSLRKTYGAQAFPEGGGEFALACLAVDNVPALGERLAANGVAFHREGRRILVDPAAAMGSALAFEPAS